MKENTCNWTKQELEEIYSILNRDYFIWKQHTRNKYSLHEDALKQLNILNDYITDFKNLKEFSQNEKKLSICGNVHSIRTVVKWMVDDGRLSLEDYERFFETRFKTFQKMKDNWDSWYLNSKK